MLLNPECPTDIAEENRQVMDKVLAFLRAPTQRAEYALLTGPSGSGKSTISMIAVHHEGATVLDMNDQYTAHAGGNGLGLHSQLEPKQVLTNFVTARTLDQFFTRSNDGTMQAPTRVVLLDDIHVMAARDRSLMPMLVRFSTDRSVCCKFLMTCHVDSLAIAGDVGGIAEAQGMVMKVRPPDLMHVMDFITARLDRMQVTYQHDTLASMMSTNVQDLLNNIDHWLKHPRSSSSDSHRDRMIGMTPKDLAMHIVWDACSFDDVCPVVDCECGDLFMYVYENWRAAVKHLGSQKIRSGKDTLQKLCSVQRATMSSIHMDYYAMQNAEWRLKDYSAIYRYGTMATHLACLRPENKSTRPPLSAALQRMSGMGRTHPMYAMSPGMSPVMHDPNTWLTFCDCQSSLYGPGAPKPVQAYVAALGREPKRSSQICVPNE